MARSLHLGSIIPPCLVVDHIEVGAGLTITARPKTASARCPRCEGVSSRVHSRYTRTLSDLPVAGRRVVITISVRRFRCVDSECRTKVFAERLEPDLAAARDGWTLSSIISVSRSVAGRRRASPAD